MKMNPLSTAAIWTAFFVTAASASQVEMYEGASDASKAAGVSEFEKADSPPQIERVRVFLVAGQSNAEGRAIPTNLPISPVNLQAPQEDVAFFTGIRGPLRDLQPDNPFGPEITLGRRLADFSSGDGSSRIAIIKYADGGTDLENDWRGGGDATTTGDGPEYAILQRTVTSGLSSLSRAYPGAKVIVEGIVWVQGERDVRQGFHNNYEVNLTEFIADIRETYGDGLPFVVVRLSSGQTDLPLDNLSVVRAAQTEVANADPRVALIDSDSFGLLSDDLHFNALGQQQMGDAAAFALASFFPIESIGISFVNESLIEIRVFDSLEDFQYSLETSDSLGLSPWTPVETLTSSGGVRLFEFTPTVDETSRFFRVSRLGQP